jgi:hypothetical protein
MYKYEISRVIAIFDGSSFECVINLGMGVYLKKNIMMSDIHSPSPNSLDENEKQYGLRAKEKLNYYIRKPPIYLEVDKYYDNIVWGKVYTDEFDDSINWIMYLKGYVWERTDEHEHKTFTLNSLS